MPCLWQTSSQIESIGVPQTGSRHLGVASVRGRSRVPRPAAKRKAFMVSSSQKGARKAVSSETRREARLPAPSHFRGFPPGHLIRNKAPTATGSVVAVDERIVHNYLSTLGIKPEG